MVALDARDDAVLGAAQAIAARGPTRVVLVHAAASPGSRGELEALASRVGAEARAWAGRPDEVPGGLAAEAGADLLLVGRDAGPAEQPGRQARAILRAAACPVLVVPRGCSPRFARATVGMDLSSEALDALVLAARLCEQVEAVAVIAPEDAHEDAAAVRAALSERFEAAAAERGMRGVPFRAVAGGSPADALLAAAQGSDLLAVGSRGLSPLATVFLGSTAERLAGRSDVPVLVVGRRSEPRGLLGALFRT